MTGDNKSRGIGAAIGFAISATVIIYLDRHNGPKPEHQRVTPAVVAAPIATQSQSQVVELNAKNAEQAEEIARLRLAIDADRARDQLRPAKHALDPKRQDLIQFAEMSRKELRSEIELAVSDVARYAAEGSYAPDVHEKLYRRVNTLFDMRGLQSDENAWLRQAVSTLNAIATRHAEESFKDGDDAAVVRVGLSFGDWTFRLSSPQKQSLNNVLEQTAKRLRSAG